jgi:YVTN family beta-propeller protein
MNELLLSPDIMYEMVCLATIMSITLFSIIMIPTDVVGSAMPANTPGVNIPIKVGEVPVAIAVNPNNDLVYVANSASEAVSVIDSTTNVVTNDITVGENASDIAVNPNNDLVYVANVFSNTVSVIDSTTNEVVTNNITVGHSPSGIAVNPNNDLVYVANDFSNTVSVIDSTTNEVVTNNITVGDYPYGVAVNPNNDLVYVANSESDTVSAIDSKANDIVVRASFDINPTDSGRIICNKEKIPTNEYKTIKFDSLCEAIPNNGFAFSSWVKRNLESNSSITITESTPNPNPLLNLLFPNPNANVLSTFNIDSSGHFVANFREAPPPVPDGIWIALFSILLGTFMPSLIRWINGWKQRRRFYKYKEELPSKYGNKSDYKKREAIDDEVTELYAKGKINETQQKMLKDKIAEHYDDRSDTGLTSAGI